MKSRSRRKRSSSLSRIQRGFLGVAAIGAAAVAIRSLPDLRRYLRMHRM